MRLIEAEEEMKKYYLGRTVRIDALRRMGTIVGQTWEHGNSPAEYQVNVTGTGEEVLCKTSDITLYEE